MDATAELPSDDFVRLRLHRPSHFHWAPGQTAYLIMPSVSRLPFEAHPFTIASYDSTLLDVPQEQEPHGDDSTQFSVAEHTFGPSASFWKEVVFFINVRKGFTARLKEAASKGDKLKVFIDGPYGPSPNLGSYDMSVLIAGWLLTFFYEYCLCISTFRWIWCLVHVPDIVGHHRVCQLDSLYIYFSLRTCLEMSAKVKAIAAALFLSGQFGTQVNVIHALIGLLKHGQD